MRKISRRLFLLALLSACSPIQLETQPPPTFDLVPTLGPIPTQIPIPTLVPVSTLVPSPAPISKLAEQVDSPVPIDVVVFDSDTSCHSSIVAPIVPAVIPPVTGVDKTTGRHMMGTVQMLDPVSYRLKVTGLVDHPLSLSYDELRCMPKITETVTTTCYSFQDTATWSGVLISEVLNKAGIQSGAKKVIQVAADANRTVTLDMAMDQHNFLAYQMGDNPLPILFGFPVRSIFVDVAGQYSVKWLTSLEVI